MKVSNLPFLSVEKALPKFSKTHLGRDQVLSLRLEDCGPLVDPESFGMIEAGVDPKPFGRVEVRVDSKSFGREEVGVHPKSFGREEVGVDSKSFGRGEV